MSIEITYKMENNNNITRIKTPAMVAKLTIQTTWAIP